jgi:hypothetical protein
MTSMLWEFFVVGLLLYGLAALAIPLLIRRRPLLAFTPNVRWGGAHPRLVTAVRTSTIRPNMRSRTTSGCPSRRTRSAPTLQRRHRH